MRRLNERLARGWTLVATRYLPFADAASETLPLARLLRLGLFQVSVGMALVLLGGVLNRVMIIELGVPASLVAVMLALPVVAAPFRALIGHRSDTHRSALGWRRVPYIWFGSLLQFGGFAIMPFALIVLSGDTHGPAWIGQAGAALAFLLVGVGLHTTQTAGLALAGDLAGPDTRPRVVALLYVMLLLGTVASALAASVLLEEFSQLRLVKVVQGAALLTIVLNVIALWKQETRRPARQAPLAPPFGEAWRGLCRTPGFRRFLCAVALGSAAFSMQEVLLEPYGAAVLGLSVSGTTVLTALFAGGSLAAFAYAARRLGVGADVHRLAALGALAGVAAFFAVVFAAPLHAVPLLGAGAFLIGFGAGLFAVATLTSAMARDQHGASGLALGAWGAAQATAAGLGIALGGVLRDVVSTLGTSGLLGAGMRSDAAGYVVVFHLEIILLFAALVAIGPLVRRDPARTASTAGRLGLAELPS
ncbi:MAG: BCD family MFS transporter [Gammaproteobacteria bacterium]